jgi:hypothetical protein
MIVQRDLGALAVRVVFRLFGTLLAPLLVLFGLFATVVALSSGATAAPVYGYDAQIRAYDAQIHAYDTAANSVQLHTSAAAPVVSQDGFDDPDETVAQATGPLSVLLSLSVAANSGARFVAAADGTVIDTQAPALAQQIDDVVTSLRTMYRPGFDGGS